jgi:cellobiose phosphorylase
MELLAVRKTAPFLVQTFLRNTTTIICQDSSGQTERKLKTRGWSSTVGVAPTIKPSDSELFVLQLAAELLLATKSTAFLSEELPPFGGNTSAPKASVISLLLRCQRVAETVIGVGRHGLMRMQSGDWSDLIMSRVNITYNSARYKHAVEVCLRNAFFGRHF